MLTQSLRRSKRVIAATTTMLLLLIGGLATSLTQWSRAEAAVAAALVSGGKERDARIVAEDARAEAEAARSSADQARADAEAQRKLAEQTAIDAKKAQEDADFQRQQQMICLTTLLRAPHDMSAALPRFREVCEEAEARSRGKNAYLANCLHNLARLLDATGDYEEAAVHYRRVVDIRKSVYAGPRSRRGPVSADDDDRTAFGPRGRPLPQREMEPRRLAHTLIDLGHVLYRLDRFEEAEASFLEAEQLGAELALGMQIQLDVGLGRTLARLARFDEAELALLDAFAACGEARRGEGGVDRSIAHGLVELYEAWHAADPQGNHAEQFAQWRSHLATLTTPEPR